MKDDSFEKKIRERMKAKEELNNALKKMLRKLEDSQKTEDNKGKSK